MSFKFFPILQTLERKAVFLREKRKRKKESFCSFRFQNAARFVFAIIYISYLKLKSFFYKMKLLYLCTKRPYKDKLSLSAIS